MTNFSRFQEGSRPFILFLVLIAVSSFNVTCSVAQLEKSLLWEVKGDGNRPSSYLFGTIHIICKEDLVFPQKVKEAFARCGTLFLENNIDDSRERSKVKEQLLGPEGYSLKAVFDPLDYDRLARYFKDSLKTDLLKMEKFRPVAVFVVLLNKVSPCKASLNMETELAKMANEKGMERKAFEPFTQVLSGFPQTDKDMAKGVMEMLDDINGGKSAYDSIFYLYKQQDITSLYHLSNKKKKETNVGGRNKKWIPMIEEQISEGPAFFAVGATHLAGDDGLISLLRKKGYKLEPVKE